jgi:hypothetical protein
VEDLVEFVLSLGEKAIASLLRDEPLAAVGDTQETANPSRRVERSIDFDRLDRHQLGVPSREPSFLGQRLADGRGEGGNGAPLEPQQLGTELATDRLGVAAPGERSGMHDLELAQGRRRIVPEVLLGPGRSVGGVLVVAKQRSGLLRVHF